MKTDAKATPSRADYLIEFFDEMVFFLPKINKQRTGMIWDVKKRINSHDELLEACKKALRDTKIHGYINLSTHKLLEQAIQKAEGKL